MAPVRRWLARGLSEDGAQLVEFALVLPLLLLLVLGIAEFGFVFQRYEVVTNAAREGARLAVLPGYTIPGAPPLYPAVRPRVVAYLSSGRVPVTLTNPRVDVVDVPVAVGAGKTISAKRVTVTYAYTFQFLNALSAFFGSDYTEFDLIAVSEMRTEGGS